MGAPNIREFAPAPNSYVDIRDFESPEHLAETLQAIAYNESAFNALLAWRAHGVSSSFKTLMHASMTRSEVYGEGKHHGCQHEVDLRHLHKAMCERLVNVTRRSGLSC